MAGQYGAKPQFLIVGAARSGTTSMARYLGQNSQIYMAPGEVHYFDLNHEAPRDWYFRRFRKGLVNGDHSPYYMISDVFARRAAQAVRDVKIIALCREPVARAYSHYYRNGRQGEEQLPFVEALRVEKTRIAPFTVRGLWGHPVVRRYSYALRGQYADLLDGWLMHFKREQIMAIKSEDFFADMFGVVGEVCDFLGVRRHEFKHKKHQVQRYTKRLEDAEREQVAGIFEASNKRLAADWGISW